MSVRGILLVSQVAIMAASAASALAVAGEERPQSLQPVSLSISKASEGPAGEVSTATRPLDLKKLTMSDFGDADER